MNISSELPRKLKFSVKTAWPSLQRVDQLEKCTYGFVFITLSLSPVRKPPTQLSEHLPSMGLLVQEIPRGKVVPYCELTAELTTW